MMHLSVATWKIQTSVLLKEKEGVLLVLYGFNSLGGEHEIFVLPSHG